MKRAPFALFDIDGTLVLGQPESWRSHEALAALEVNRPVAQRIRKHVAAGWRVEFLTARTEAERAVTEAQVREATGIESPVVWMQPRWRGHAAIRPFKARLKRRLQPDVSVGDMPHDAEAARQAGVHFMAVWDFAKGLPLPGEVVA